MSIGAVGNVFNIIRQINLNEIKKEAEGRFTIAVLGAESLAGRLAAALSEAPGMEGIHPWVEVLPLSLPIEAGDLSRYDLALLASETLELDPAADSALRRLDEARVPTVVVVASDEAQQRVGAALPRPREAARVVLPASLDGDRVKDELIPAIAHTLPEGRRLALGKQLPRFRGPLARQLIEDTSRANAVYAVTTGIGEVVPGLNIALGAADILVLTKNQLVMAYKLALLNGKEGEPRDIMGEVVGVIGGGFLFRQIARELVGMIPVVGLLPKVAVSYAGTWVIGRSVHLWASGGQALDVHELRGLYDEALQRGRAVAESLVERVRREKPAALPAPNDTEIAPAPRPRWWHRIPLVGRLFRRKRMKDEG